MHRAAISALYARLTLLVKNPESNKRLNLTLQDLAAGKLPAADTPHSLPRGFSAANLAQRLLSPFHTGTWNIAPRIFPCCSLGNASIPHEDPMRRFYHENGPGVLTREPPSTETEKFLLLRF